MTSADISALGDLNPVEPLELEDGVYKDQLEAPPLPKKGEYVVQAPESFSAAAFGKTQAGFLSASIDPKIVGPTNEGYTIRFTKVSAKTYKRGGVNVSQLGDYLRATGRRTQVGSDAQAQANAVAETANQTYRIEGDWKAYDKVSKWSVEGMEKFPSDGNGGYEPWIPSPTTKDEITGKPVMLRAQFFVKRFLAAS